MAEIKDPAIRLFGKTIPLLIISKNSGVSVVNSTAFEDNRLNRVRKEEEEENKESSRGKPIEIEEENHTTSISEEMKDPGSSSGVTENSQEPSIDKEIPKPKASENKKQSETGISEEKTLKKPDKIIPCCRCNSMDTKFCYYNNYNVNQPRYFCKSCQRYWTDGGLMRNVPVGAGRRKNKNSSSPYRQITLVEDLQTAQNDAPNGIHKSKLKENGRVLAFGSNAPLCESMDGIQNGFYRPEDHRIRVYREGVNGDEHSSESSITVCNSLEEGSKIPYYPGAPWPYPSQWGSHWGSTAPGIWGLPWMIPLSSSSPYHGAMGTSPSSSTLGKHSRDGDMLNTSNLEKGDTLKEIKSERCLWMPKTLRIGDPSEAARSSIWTTLGIKNEKADSICGGMLFNGFQSKGDQKIQKAETSQVLQANPAALSRWLNFHESS